MRRFALLFFNLLIFAFVSAQEMGSISHKQRMIEAINTGNFELAAEELPLVEDWRYEKDSIKIDIDNALLFSAHIDSLHIEKSLSDSVCFYTAQNCLCVGNDLLNEKKYEEALPYFQVLEKVRKDLYGENHPKYASALYGLGLAYLKIEDFQNAEKYLLQALELRKNILGENHSAYAYVLYDLGRLYYYKQDYKKSEKFYTEALEAYKIVYGEHHVSTADILNDLGNAYDEAKEYAKAEDSYVRAVKLYENFAGITYPNYLLTLDNLRIHYEIIGDLSKTEECYLKIAEIQRKTLSPNDLGYAQSIYDLGELYEEIGNYPKAKECYRQVASIYKNALGENHPDYLGVLSRLGIMYENLCDYAKAEKCYFQVADIRKNILGTSHPDYAWSLNDLGALYEEKGDYNNAEKYYIAALNIFKTCNNQREGIASICSNLTGFYLTTGSYSKAEYYALQSLQIRRDTFGTQHLDYAKSLDLYAELCDEMGDYTKAEEYYTEALNIRKIILGEYHPEYATSLQNIGVLYQEKGDFANAEKCDLEALNIYNRIYGDPHPDGAMVLCNLGGLYFTMGDYKKALQNFSKAYNTCKTVLGEQHERNTLPLVGIGMVYMKTGDHEKSLHYINQALQICKNTHGINHPEYARIIECMGVAYIECGDYKKGIDYCKKALIMRNKIYGKRHKLYAQTLDNIGVCYIYIGNYAKAKKFLVKAEETRKAALSIKHPEYANSLENLGLLYFRMNNYTQAEMYYSQEDQIKRDYFLHSLNFMSEHQRESYWSTMKNNYEETYPSFIYQYHFQKPSISTFAYNNELFMKGLLLNSSETIKRSIAESGDTTLIRQWDELTTLKQQIIIWEEKDPQAAYLEELRTKAEQLEKQITASSAAFRENQAQWSITWDSVRSHLGSNQVAVEYMVAPLNEDSTMYCALLLRKKSKYPELISLFEEKEVLSLINTTTENQTSFTYSFDGKGEQLSSLIWSKILPRIQQGETIYFAPSGLLHQVAIEALPYNSVYTMGDMYNLVRLSSTREIVFNKNANQHTTATLYGGIQYNVDAEELLAESEQYSSLTLLASRGIENDTLNRGSVKYLPGTKREVEQINQMLSANNLSVQIFSSVSANEESFKALSGTHQNILHIATHGFYWSDSIAQKKDYFLQHSLRLSSERPKQKTIDPLNRCGLLMAGANLALSGQSADLPEGVQDGILTAKEISLLDLRDADLVVLSACETGKGEITGEGVFGLQRAFKQAGAQTIIMSLWPVNDAATQLLMTEFYRNWITNHQSKREAFRNAQNTVRSKYKDPVYWAGFIMSD